VSCSVIKGRGEAAGMFSHWVCS